MPVTPRNLPLHELIGLEVEVAEASNRSLVGIKGTVVDETKNTLLVRTGRGDKRIPKRHTKFIFTLPDKRKVKVDGNILAVRPEDRLKLRLRVW